MAAPLSLRGLEEKKEKTSLVAKTFTMSNIDRRDFFVLNVATFSDTARPNELRSVSIDAENK